MDITVIEVAILLVIGLLAGVLGGMVGIGGSIIMIPAMALVFRSHEWANQHLYQAAAMVVNIAVAVPSAVRHSRAGAIRADLFRMLLLPTAAFILVGVWVSNLLDGRQLAMLFAVFLAYIGTRNLIGLLRKKPDLPESGIRITRARATTVGGVMGFMAGLLGIGGGIVAVPLMQVLCRMPLRQAIATSSAVMAITSILGSAFKIGTLSEHGRHWHEALLIAACLAPTGVIGAIIGAGLTHKLPVQHVRTVFALLLIVTAAKMAGLF